VLKKYNFRYTRTENQFGACIFIYPKKLNNWKQIIDFLQPALPNSAKVYT